MINKNVLFPVDTEAFHVVFSFGMHAAEQNCHDTVGIDCHECDSLLMQETVFTSERKASACLTCMTNSYFNDGTLNQTQQPVKKVTTAI